MLTTNAHESTRIVAGQSNMRSGIRTRSLNFIQQHDSKIAEKSGGRAQRQRLQIELGGYLYLSSSRCIRPLPRGFTGHVARPARSIRNTMLANEAPESVLPHGASRRD